MVGIRRDGDLGQNRRVVSEADFKFLDQHGEYQADFGEREPGADTDAGARAERHVGVSVRQRLVAKKAGRIEGFRVVP